MVDNTNISKQEVLNVRVDDAMKSVKALKTEINKLRDSTLSLTKGSDEYNKVVEELQSKQRLLNETMSLTKKESIALEGSYDSLVYRMGLLKKEWRATNDEAKRNELGKQIEDINTQLKSLDASTGNFQRNVGNYEGAIENSFKSLKEEIKEARSELLNAEEGSEEYAKAMERLSDAQFQLRDMNEKSRYAVADLGEQLSNVAGIASGLASGFGAVQGALVLLGKDTEDYEEVMKKLTATIAIVNGLQGLEGLKDRIDGLVLSISSVTKLSKGWIGVIALIASALATTIGLIAKKKRTIDELTITQTEYNDLVLESQKGEISGIAKQIALNESLQKIIEDTSYSYEQRVKASKLLLKQLEFEVNETNIMVALEGKFADVVKKSNDKLIERTRAIAVLQTTTNLYNELISKQIELINLERQLNSDEKDFTFGDKLKKNLRGVVGVVQSLDEVADERISKNIEKLKTEIEYLIKSIEDFADTSISDVLNGLFDEDDVKKQDELANEELSILDKVYKRKIEYASLSEDNEKKVYNLSLEWYKKRKEILEKYIADAKEIPTNEEVIRKLTEQILDDDLEVAKLHYNEKKKLLTEEKEDRDNLIKELSSNYSLQKELSKDNLDYQINLINGKLLELFNLQTEWNAKGYEITDEFKNLIISLQKDKANAEIEIEKNKQKEIEELREQNRKNESDQLSNLDWQTDYDIRTNNIKNREFGKDTKDTEFNILLKSLEQRKELLKNFWERAKEDGDGEAMLDYQRELAEAELEIDELKYNEKIRLQEEYNKKVENILNGVSKSFNLAGDYVNAYYRIKEANARKDEEITEQEAEKLKEIQIAEVWINTLAGMVSAFASAQKLGFPLGQIVGSAQAGAVLAMGLANKKQIEAQSITGGSSGNNNISMPTMPSVNTNFTNQPYQYNRNLTGYKEVEELNKARRVYVLESDITEAQNATKIKVSESTF